MIKLFKLFKISLISLMLLGLIVPTVFLGQPKNQALASEDLDPPQLLEFDFSPKNIDTNIGPQTVTFTMRVTDNLSGFDNGFVLWAIRSPSGQQVVDGLVHGVTLISGNDLDGRYQFSVTFPQYSEAGTWYINYLIIRDKVRNSDVLNEQDLIDLGFPTKLELISIPDDTIPPQLQEFSFSPTHINTSENPQTVIFTMRVTDNLSGFDNGFVLWTVRSPSGQQVVDGLVHGVPRISGNDLDGIYQFSVTFPQYSEAGIWYVNYLLIRDKVRNSNWLNEQDLIDLGFPTKLENSLEVPVCGNNNCEAGETFENCHRDCTEQGIEKYFPYWTFSRDEEYFPASFYFDSDANTENNQENYDDWVSGLPPRYVYIHTVEDASYFTIQYWLYETFNYHKRCCDHEHDWDGTIFVVFDKNNFTQPMEVRFARHYYIVSYPWAKPELKKIDNTHVIAYVAKGSHGAYPTIIMKSGDVFYPGGRQLGPDDFNWYYTAKGRGCFNERSLPVQGEENREFCNLEPVLLKGAFQPYPQEWEAGYEGYWPRDFIADYYEISGIHHSFDAPWIRDKWEETRPEGWSNWIEFLLGSAADLHVYDPFDRHVGINYETGEPEIQIPNAVYRVSFDVQRILIPDSIDGDYRVEIIGKEDGVYNLITVRNKEEQFIYWKENKDIPISKDEIHAFVQNPSPRMIPKILKEDSIAKLEELKGNSEEAGIHTGTGLAIFQAGGVFISYKDGGWTKVGSMIINGIIGICFYVLLLLVIYGILRITKLLKKWKLEINKKVVFILSILGIIFGALLVYLISICLDPYKLYKSIPPFIIFIPGLIVSILVFVLCYILLKKFPTVWKDIKMRLIYITLELAAFVYGGYLLFFIMIERDFTTEFFLEMIRVFLKFPWVFLYFLLVSLYFGFFVLVYSNIIPLAVAYFATKGIKNKTWRIILMIVLAILICITSGYLLVIAHPPFT